MLIGRASPDFDVCGIKLGDLRVLRRVSLPAGLEVVGEGWFAEASVESVDFPASVRLIERCAFWGARALSALTFAKRSRLDEVGELAFAGCGLVRVKFPRGLKVVGARAFEGCSGLRAFGFGLGARMERVGAGAFDGTALGKKFKLCGVGDAK